MTTCIYCKGDSSTSVGIPHALPEALAKNNLVMPRGAECDACNSYAGRRLDSNLVRYPHIAVTIQTLGAPGKRGKWRAHLGGVRRDRVDHTTVRLSLRIGPSDVVAEGDRFHVKGPMVTDPEFDFLRFRRALHHVALGTIAAQEGVEAALAPAYDRVRQYIRNPRPRTDSWPYGQVEHRVKKIPRLLALGIIEFERVDLVRIQVCHLTFIVDPSGSGALERAMLAIGGLFVPANATKPPDAMIETVVRRSVAG